MSHSITQRPSYEPSSHADSLPAGAEAKKTSTRRNGAIELMRFVCAIVIAGYHLGCSLDEKHELFRHGYMAVEFFFMVSGYLLAQSLAKFEVATTDEVLKTSLTYIGKKYRSFLPYHIIAAIFISIAWIPYFHLSLKQWVLQMAEAVPNLLLVQAVGFKMAPWYVPTWYLSVMLLCLWILTPILLKHAKYYSLYLSPLLSLILLGMVYRYLGDFDAHTFQVDKSINFGFLRGFAEMSLGCTSYYIIESGILETCRRAVWRIAGCGCLCFVLAYLFVGHWCEMQCPLILCTFLLVTIAFYDAEATRFLNHPLVYFLGRLSLPIFLCHSIVRYEILEIHSLHSYGAQLSAFLLATLCLSIICLLLGDGLRKMMHKSLSQN